MSRPVPAIATTISGMDSLNLVAALINVSIPLRGTKRLTLTTNGAWAGRPSFLRTSNFSLVVKGLNRSTSTPGGTIRVGRDCCAARSASAAG